MMHDQIQKAKVKGLIIVVIIISINCCSVADQCNMDTSLFSIPRETIDKHLLADCVSYNKVQGIDIDAYETINGDTTIRLIYSGKNNDDLYMVSYAIPVESQDSLYIQKYLSSLGATIFTTYSRTGQFGVYNFRKNSLFQGRISDDYLILSSPLVFE